MHDDVSIFFFLEGLFEQLIDRHVPHIPCFRNLQRFVMTGDRNVTISDAGLVLFCAQQSLTHVALQTFHCDNALFEALNFARVRLSRLENLILGSLSSCFFLSLKTLSGVIV